MLSFWRFCCCFALKFVADCFGRQIFGDLSAFQIKPPPESFAAACGWIDNTSKFIWWRRGCNCCFRFLCLLLSGRNIAAADKFVGSLIVVWFIDPTSLAAASGRCIDGQSSSPGEWLMHGGCLFLSSGDAREVVSPRQGLIVRPKWVEMQIQQSKYNNQSNYR